MTKVIIVNGSPRKNGNTAKLLKEAQRGAEEKGAQTEYFNLYNYSYKGCVSCFACKLKNAKTNGLCAYKDELTPILQKILEADVLITGSPIYFSYPSGEFRSFIERLAYPLLTYLVDEKTGGLKRVLSKTIPTGVILTMNVPEKMFIDWNYAPILEENAKTLNSVLGYAETLYAYDTYQFPNYSKYDCTLFNESDKEKSRAELFPKDMERAYALAQKLIDKAESR